MTRSRLTRLLATTLAAALTSFAAQKETPLPKELPAYGATKAYQPPPVTQVKLDNGLTVWFVPASGFPKVALVLAVHGGYAVDPKPRPGISDLLAATLSQGTSTRNARQIAEDLQACGGDIEADADADGIELGTSVLAEKLEPALQLLADVAQNATFPDREVAIAKQNAASSLEAQEAEPGFLGNRALYRAIFGEHPYSITSPTKESIANTTPAELKTEYARRFRPDQAVLIAVGDFDGKQLETAIRKDFDAWKKPATPADLSVPPPPSNISKSAYYVPRPNSVQTAFYIGGLAPTLGQKDYEAASMANAIYGGMFGSRLILNIREDKGYTYSPRSRITPFESTGVLVTSADVRNAVTGASFNEISYELNRIATTGPEPSELEHAKSYLIGSIAIRLQSHAALARTLSQYWAHSLSPDDLAHRGERIEKISATDVEQAGRTYFPMWRMTTVAVGEEKVIKEELAPFGLEFKKVEAAPEK